MATIRAKIQASYARDHKVVVAGIAKGRVVSNIANRTGFGRKWKKYIHRRSIDAYLPKVNFNTIMHEVIGFAGRVQEG